MTTHAIEVKRANAAGLATAIRDQIAAIKARGGAVVSVQLVPPERGRTAGAKKAAHAATITYRDGESST